VYFRIFGWYSFAFVIICHHLSYFIMLIYCLVWRYTRKYPNKTLNRHFLFLLLVFVAFLYTFWCWNDWKDNDMSHFPFLQIIELFIYWMNMPYISKNLKNKKHRLGFLSVFCLPLKKCNRYLYTSHFNIFKMLVRCPYRAI
jgi:hypothetical protein